MPRDRDYAHEAVLPPDERLTRLEQVLLGKATVAQTVLRFLVGEPEGKSLRNNWTTWSTYKVLCDDELRNEALTDFFNLAVTSKSTRSVVVGLSTIERPVTKEGIPAGMPFMVAMAKWFTHYKKVSIQDKLELTPEALGKDCHHYVPLYLRQLAGRSLPPFLYKDHEKMEMHERMVRMYKEREKTAQWAKEQMQPRRFWPTVVAAIKSPDIPNLFVPYETLEATVEGKKRKERLEYQNERRRKKRKEMKESEEVEEAEESEEEGG
jgi:hypothetical protein